MNRFAYYMSGYALKAFTGFSKANISLHGQENIPEGSVIFTANHFTRMETVLLPYFIHGLIKKPVWSLAAAELFNGSLKGVLDAMGAVSTKAPNRDLVIIKNLIAGDDAWIIFPEGMMVKNKKLIKKDQFSLSEDGNIQRPHTGAATIALRTEFYRNRMKRMQKLNMNEFNRLAGLFELNKDKDIEKVLEKQTFIVPVNITYYPVRAKENFLSSIAENIMKQPSPRAMDELMTEGTMILSGVDVDIRFGEAIRIKDYFNNSFIESDLTSKRKIEFDDNISSKPIMRKNAIEIMERYMSSVYMMTTLNYDHIFASILRYLPENVNGIDEYDFRCRAFLAATGEILESDQYLHKSLFDNQIHLLTDDRLNRYEDFIQTAVDTKVVRLEKNKIFRNKTMLDSTPGFHRIRIENPVSVMANEVEPLVIIQHYIKKLAEKDCNLIMELVRERLIKKAEKDFDDDYDKYYIKGESKPKKIGKPFLLKPDKSRAGVLLIHGYMAAPAEMKEFADYLYDHGFAVYVPRLKGHGTAPEDLAETQYDKWIESVEEGFVILRHLCKNVFVGGFSTGAGLALDLETRVEDIKAVFAVSPPMKLNDFGARFAPALDIWNQMMTKAHLHGITKRFVDNIPEHPDINYVRNPISGVRQLEKFMESVESKLENIEVPALIVQSRNDPVVDFKGAEKVFKSIGSEKKEYFLFDYNRHGILIGDDVKRIYSAIRNFLESV